MSYDPKKRYPGLASVYAQTMDGWQDAYEDVSAMSSSMVAGKPVIFDLSKAVSDPSLPYVPPKQRLSLREYMEQQTIEIYKPTEQDGDFRFEMPVDPPQSIPVYNECWLGGAAVWDDENAGFLNWIYWIGLALNEDTPDEYQFCKLGVSSLFLGRKRKHLPDGFSDTIRENAFLIWERAQRDWLTEVVEKKKSGV